MISVSAQSNKSNRKYKKRVLENKNGQDQAFRTVCFEGKLKK